MGDDFKPDKIAEERAGNMGRSGRLKWEPRERFVRLRFPRGQVGSGPRHIRLHVRFENPDFGRKGPRVFGSKRSSIKSDR